MDHTPAVFCLTLDQIDRLDRLLRTIAAHGDVIAVSARDGLAAQTLPTLGEAIYEAAQAACEILEQRVVGRRGDG